MSFAAFYRSSSYLLVAAGFLALAGTGTLNAVALVLFFSAFAASWSLDTSRIRRAVPDWIWLTLMSACLVYAGAEYAFLSRPVRQALIHFLLLATGVKLVSRATDRDYIHLYLLSLSALLTAATITTGIAFLACLNRCRGNTPPSRNYTPISFLSTSQGNSARKRSSFIANSLKSSSGECPPLRS